MRDKSKEWIVITFESTLLVYRRGHGPGRASVTPRRDERALEAAGLDGAGAVIVDLEDAVPP